MKLGAFPLALATCVLLLAGCGNSTPPTGPGEIIIVPPPPPPPPPPPVLGVTRLLAFGDSMTEGRTSPALPTAALRSACELSYPEAFPYSCPLYNLMTARYTTQTISLFNAGLGGEPAVGSATLGRFSEALSESKPEVVFLWEGANDLLALSGSTNATVIDEGITRTVNALEEMVKEARRRNIRIFVATLPPQRLKGTPPRGEAAPLLEEFNEELKRMAANKGAQVVDLNALVPLSMVGQDGLHLTQAGYQRVAEILLEALKQFEVTASAQQ